MNNAEFFKEQVTKPSAWSEMGGNYVSFSMSKECYQKDEVNIRALVKKYKLKEYWFSRNTVTFRLQ